MNSGPIVARIRAGAQGKKSAQDAASRGHLRRPGDRGYSRQSGTNANYAALLSETRPEVIRDEKQNQAYVRLPERLTSKKSVTRAEEKLIELLAVLIEDFEAKHVPVPEATPVEIIRHLMEAHGLRQKDLVSIFGTESIASEVLHCKRELTKEHIKRLSVRFGVSPAVFF